MTKPTVLFVCVSNAGKSQMAEALLRRRVGDAIDIHSAGTKPKPVEAGVNAESAASVALVGASMAHAIPKDIDPDLLRTADRVVILGADAQVEPVEGLGGTIERWDTGEPSLRGIEGAERMDLIRDDIDARVGALASEFGVQQRPSVMFVCVHNAGRSQMAAAYAHHLSGGAVEVRWGRAGPAAADNPARPGGVAGGGHRHLRGEAEDPHPAGGAGLRRGHHDGLRRRVPVLPRQAL